MTKYEYCSYFALCRKFVKFSPLLKALHISQGNFSKFMTGKPDYQIFMSLENLERLYEAVHIVLSTLLDES